MFFIQIFFFSSLWYKQQFKGNRKLDLAQLEKRQKETDAFFTHVSWTSSDQQRRQIWVNIGSGFPQCFELKDKKNIWKPTFATFLLDKWANICSLMLAILQVSIFSLWQDRRIVSGCEKCVATRRVSTESKRSPSFHVLTLKNECATCRPGGISIVHMVPFSC